MYAGRGNKELCKCLKSGHLVTEQVGGLAGGRMVAWELLQELGLLQQHGGSPNTKPQLSTVARK